MTDSMFDLSLRVVPMLYLWLEQWSWATSMFGTQAEGDRHTPSHDCRSLLRQTLFFFPVCFFKKRAGRGDDVIR